MHYIHIMRKPGEGRGKGKEGKFEAIMMENFHKLLLDTRIYKEESQIILGRIHTKRKSALRHAILKLQKSKM